MKKIPIEVSARHVHLSQKDLEALFGAGALKGTPGAILIGPKNKIRIKQGVINA